MFTDFGFNVTSTKEIADALGDKNKISKVFWDTLLAKSILLLISIFVFCSILYSFEKFRSDELLFLLSFINVFASVLLPLWLFQGIEKMGLLVIVNTIPRILMCVITFLVVKNSNDYHLALLIQVLANFASSILSLVLVFHFKLISFIKPNLKNAKDHIINGWHIFATSLSSNLYTTTNTVILGLVVGDIPVGVYSASDKIIRAIIGLLSSITQVVFPRVNVYYAESKEKCLHFVKQIIFTMSAICLIIAVGIYFFADDIIKIMYKNGDFLSSVDVLRYSVLLPLFSVINGVIAINIFITFGYKKALLKFVFIGCVFSLTAIFPFVTFFKEIGAVICATLTEIIIFCFLIVFINKNLLNHEWAKK